METSAAERTVFVVDDDEAARHSLVTLLTADGLITRGFPSAAAFLSELCPGWSRGCLITDLSMPDADGVALIQTLKRLGALLPVIVVTGDADLAKAVDVMKAGARDVLQKPFDSDRILRAARAGLEENDAAVDACATRSRIARRIESLTLRERQVLDLIMEGASNKVVAQRLTISPRTVEIYRSNVMSKMRADSLSELIRMTLAAGAA